MRAVYVHAGTRRPTDAAARLSFLIVSTLTAIVALVVFATAYGGRPALDTDRTSQTSGASAVRDEVNRASVAPAIGTRSPTRPPASPAELKAREDRAKSAQFLGQLQYAILANDPEMLTRSSP